MTPDKKKHESLLTALGFGAALFFSLPMPATGRPLDLLDKPAAMSPRAESSVLLAVVRADKRLVAVGEQGRILLSDDNGQNWRQAAVPTSVTLTGVYFVDGRQGWAVGHSGVVLHSADGGASWQKQLDGINAARIHGDAVQPPGEAGPGGSEAARAMQRNAAQLLADGADKPFLDVFFLDENKGWVIGAYGLAFATSDGGRHWESIIPGISNPKFRHLYGIKPVGDKRYVVGEQGMLLVGEGDKRFTAIPSPYNGTCFGLLAGTRKELLLYGLRGNVFWSGNAGKDWQKVSVGLPVTVTAGLRLDDGKLLLADETGRLLRSDDGGQSFKPVPIPNAAYVTGIAQAADGGIILAGARGIVRIAAAALQKDMK